MTEERSYELLITGEESQVLEAIAQSIVPYSQRAQALLAIDAGSTLDQAAAVAGLKATQVRYWAGRFRNSRIQVFPADLLEDIEAVLLEQVKESKAVKKKAAKSSGKKKKKKENAGTDKKAAKKLKEGKKKKGGKDTEKEKKKGKKADKPKSKKDKKKKSATKK